MSQLESSKYKEVFNVWHWQTLDRKSSTRVKTLLGVAATAEDCYYCIKS